ncbi:unnamed protein product [Sphagnum jensenii]|jgi:hypothetical protein|uniref:Uncharacterized protein n=1 Tax=Sphagnum jensenii TaxID=128206 RepID=A0ABP0WD85_9BRYO
MHMRDLLGGLVLFLLLAEASRNVIWVANFTDAQMQQNAVSQIAEQGQQQQLNVPSLCQSVEPECKDGLTVTCKTGNYIGCDCNYIRQCRPEVLNCVRSNKTHTVSCGF